MIITAIVGMALLIGSAVVIWGIIYVKTQRNRAAVHRPPRYCIKHVHVFIDGY